MATITRTIHDLATRDYIDRRGAEGRTTKEIRRCSSAVSPARSIATSTPPVARRSLPAKLRLGYATFAVAEPALKLVLPEGEPGQATVMDHPGVEVECTELVEQGSGDTPGQM